MAKLAVIIPAAGSGTRMGTRIPKPFLEFDNAPILEHTIKCFVDVESVAQILVVSSKEWFDSIRKIFKSFDHPRINFQIVEGGSERQFSVQNALNKLDEDIDLVAVHDAVRPFVKKHHIEKCCAVALEVGGAVLAIPAKDTIKEVTESFEVLNTPNRSTLWQAQTPQIFQKDLLISSYKQAEKMEFIGTDDSSIVERMGAKVQVVEGDMENFKITFPLDLEIAELLSRRGRK